MFGQEIMIWWQLQRRGGADHMNVIMGGCALRKDRTARRGGGVALYVRKQLQFVEYSPGVD